MTKKKIDTEKIEKIKVLNQEFVGGIYRVAVPPDQNSNTVLSEVVVKLNQVIDKINDR
jgi:hypothetical protein